MAGSGLNARQGGAPVEGVMLRVGGHVQGVGYRPFVYRLARQLGVRGWVRNVQGQVQVLAQGPGSLLDEFAEGLVALAPPLARPVLDERLVREEPPLGSFEILPSQAGGQARIFIPPDYFCCDDCVKEITRPGDRRYRYPFTNCTQCGPRYTLIRSLPYDRPNTAMAGFPLCEPCRREYENPVDRRFHAEPVACPDCGPSLSLVEDGNQSAVGQRALELAVQALVRGCILAVKGVGGYHLMCDARSEEAVRRLRDRKRRPHKPLAVMFPWEGADGLAVLARHASPGADARALLCSAARPIVLVPRRADGGLAEAVAPGLAEIGAFLPYSPLHYLLLADFGGPLVATSGNLSGEPVLTGNAQAQARLDAVADLFLHHDRPIVRPADDPVWRSVDGRMRPLRLGRGCAPLELSLPGRLPEPVLAVGGQMKNTLALAWEDRLVISPHIGEMSSPRSMAVFEQVAGDLQSLYGIRARRLLVDAHPGYSTHRWARDQGLPVEPVFHHHAHASALVLDAGHRGDSLVFAWDGVGYGGDGSLWGGEALAGRPGRWRRLGSFRPFRLPGGELAARSPWRSAAALCWEAGLDWPGSPAPELVRQAWQRGVNAPTSSAVGRLFDAMAALAGWHEASYEGQGPMQLEALAADTDAFVRMPLRRDAVGLLRADWSDLLAQLLRDELPAPGIAAVVHESLARCLLEQALTLRAETGLGTVGLCGGVFQNDRLSTRARQFLEGEGFVVLQSRTVPCNDAGLSAGQVMEALGRLEAGEEGCACGS